MHDRQLSNLMNRIHCFLNAEDSLQVLGETVLDSISSSLKNRGIGVRSTKEFLRTETVSWFTLCVGRKRNSNAPVDRIDVFWDDIDSYIELSAKDDVDVLSSKTPNALREMLIGHLHGVIHARVWGSNANIFSYAARQFHASEQWMRAKLGFGIDDAIAFVRGIEELLEDNWEQRSKKGRDFLSKYVEEIDGERLESVIDRLQSQLGLHAAAILTQLHKEITENAKSIIEVNVEKLVDMTSPICGAPIVHTLLSFFSQEIGRTSSVPSATKLNPLRLNPILTHDNCYYCPIHQLLVEALVDSIHYRLVSDPDYRDTYDKLRSGWMEEETCCAFRKLVPHAKVYKNVKYGSRKEQKELDCLVHCGDFVFVVEAKAKKLSLSATEGDLKALLIDLERSIQLAAEQCSRTTRYLATVKESLFVDQDGVEFSVANSGKLTIIPVCVLGHDPRLAFFAASIQMLEKSGIITSDSLPWAIRLFDLELLSQYISSQSFLVDYVLKRTKLQSQKTTLILAVDEWDHVGAYMRGILGDGLLEIGDFESVSIVGMDDAIASYELAKSISPESMLAAPEIELPGIVKAMINAIDRLYAGDALYYTLPILTRAWQELEPLEQTIKHTCEKTYFDNTMHSVSIPNTPYSYGITFIAVTSLDSNVVSILSQICHTHLDKRSYSRWLGVICDVSKWPMFELHPELFTS